jgi:hypothetical protein
MAGSRDATETCALFFFPLDGRREARAGAFCADRLVLVFFLVRVTPRAGSLMPLPPVPSIALAARGTRGGGTLMFPLRREGPAYPHRPQSNRRRTSFMPSGVSTSACVRGCRPCSPAAAA